MLIYFNHFKQYLQIHFESPITNEIKILSSLSISKCIEYLLVFNFTFDSSLVLPIFVFVCPRISNFTYILVFISNWVHYYVQILLFLLLVEMPIFIIV